MRFSPEEVGVHQTNLLGRVSQTRPTECGHVTFFKPFNRFKQMASNSFDSNFATVHEFGGLKTFRHSLHICICDCLGRLSEMSSFARTQPAHLFTSFGSIGTPQSQHRLKKTHRQSYRSNRIAYILETLE
ncbi:hypothetical protein M514_07330 [Trichuris suis]|uniref:Uncharacterized protein n=1 Tax=Trichuris suis TaxID=68888 RepID=A0A085NFU9_9BILA|nr:hypothetical protein M513_07330 [Trichuris suis]KFD68345.1 hypothetical protein M514_07330 [Trichuris suis]